MRTILLIDPRSVWNEYLDPRLLGKEQISAADRLTEKITEHYNLRLHQAICSNEQKMHLVFHEEDKHALSTEYISNYGLLMLANELTRRGFSCKYINGDYYPSLTSFIRACTKQAEDADVVCMTSTTPQYPDTAQIAQAIPPNKIVILGGPHTINAQNIAAAGIFNAVIQGYNVIKSCDEIENMLATAPPSSVVPAGQKATRIIECFEYINVPKKFDIIPTDKLRSTLLYTYASIGCVNKCAYCCERRLLDGVTHLPIADCLEEVRYLVEEAKLRFVHFADDDFLVYKDRASHILDALEQSGIKASFSINTSPCSIMRSGTIDLIRRFVNLGLVELLIGTECFSNAVLRLNRKPYNISALRDAMAQLRKEVDIPIVTFFSMVGLPGETADTIKENLQWWKTFSDEGLFDYSLPKFFVPYPGSEAFANPEAFGIEVTSQDWSTYLRRSPARPARNLSAPDDLFVQEQLAILSFNRQ